MGFKDEAIYTDAPQPYGEMFVMRYDGTDVAAADRQPVGRRHAGVATCVTPADLRATAVVFTIRLFRIKAEDS